MPKKQVFVSYAHADNVPLGGEERGWVSWFVESLKGAAGRQAGGAEIEFWMDPRLEPQRRVNEELRRRIRESAVILALLSPRYIESVWCQGEMRTFVEEVGGGVSADRVFLVELLPTLRDDWHEAIQELSPVRFWGDGLDRPEAKTLGWPLPDARRDRDYWEEVNSLAARLARQLHGLPAQPTAQPPATSPALAPAPQPAPPPEGPLAILINADAGDHALAEETQSVLGELDVDATIAARPAVNELPADYRQRYEATLRNNHGVLIVYGAAPPAWVQAKYGEVRKVLAQERRGTWAGVLEGPPPEKLPHGLPPRNLMSLDCRQGLDKAVLGRFVQALRGGSHV